MGFLLRHELSRILRTRRAFWILVAVVALSSLVPLWRWPTASSLPRNSGEIRSVFLFFFWTQLGASALAIPALAAGTIAGERERGTYDLLRSAPLSRIVIVLPKLLACTAYVALLLLAAAPSACALYFLGGLGFETVLHCYAITFAVLLSASAICLCASARADRTAQAALRAVLHVVLWNSGPLFASLLMARNSLRLGPGIGLRLLGLVLLIVSLTTTVLVFLTGAVGTLNGVLLAPHAVISAEILQDVSSAGGKWLTCVGLALLVAAGHLIAALVMAGSTDEAEARSMSEHPLGSVAGWLLDPEVPRSILTSVFIDWGGAGAPLFRNPVFLKEVRCEFHGGARFRRRVFWGLLLIFFVLFSAFPGVRRSSIAVSFMIAVALGIVIVTAVAGASMSSELERGNIDFLRSTLLTPGAIVTGKLLASLSSCVGVLFALAWAMFFRSLGSARTTPESAATTLAQLLLSSSILLVTLVFAGSAATLASLVAGRSLSAVVLAYAVVLGILVLVPAGWWLAFPSSELPASLSPFFALEATVQDSGGAVRVPRALAFAGVYLLASAACVALAVRGIRNGGSVLFAGK
jgi:ABC-type transport system involved in multi-copper enzyme maturation permease subunit